MDASEPPAPPGSLRLHTSLLGDLLVTGWWKWRCYFALNRR
jgi:hypothetical protein